MCYRLQLKERIALPFFSLSLSLRLMFWKTALLACMNARCEVAAVKGGLLACMDAEREIVISSCVVDLRLFLAKYWHRRRSR